MRSKRKRVAKILAAMVARVLLSFISYGSVKMPLCREKIAYLLDDYIRNLVHWSGVGIKFCTEYNDSRGSWDGHRIYATDTPRKWPRKYL